MGKKTVLNIDTIHAAAVADEQHGLATEATESVFGTLAESTIGYVDREKWEKDIRAIEVEYCEKVYRNKDGSLKDESHMTKGRGKPGASNHVPPRWKFRTLLPTAWSSSKSVCGQAIDHDIKMDADSRKTATEQAIKEAKADAKVDKTPQEKFQISMDTAKKILSKIPDDDREAVLKQYGINPNAKGATFDWRIA